MILGTIFLFVLACLLNIVSLFTTVFHIVLISDLECDFINPIDMCRRVNKVKALYLFSIVGYSGDGFARASFADDAVAW